MTRAEEASLWILIGLKWECLYDVVRRAKVVKRAIPIAEYFDMHGGLAHILAIGFNPRAGRCCIHQDIISHGAVGSGFRAWWEWGLAPSQDKSGGEARNENPFCSHSVKLPEISGNSNSEVRRHGSRHIQLRV